jgi:hypothetical protein
MNLAKRPVSNPHSFRSDTNLHLLNYPHRPLPPPSVTLTCPVMFQVDKTIGTYTANEGPVRTQYKCLVPIHGFPEMKLLLLKQNYNVLSPGSYPYISVRDLYISVIGLPILLQGNMWTDPGNI